MPKWLLYSLISILFWGVWGVVSKVSSTTVSALHTQVLFAVGMIPPMVLAWYLPGQSQGTDKPRGIAWGFLTGIIGGLGNLAMFRAFELGANAAALSPLTGIYPLFTVIAALVVLGERLNRVQIAGIGFAGVAIFLLSGG
jgi:transporter family protein